MRMRWYFVFFLGSGFCSLVYEVVWLRLAMAAYGVTTPMVSIVLSMFMAGLGLGCWATGRFARRFQGQSASTPLRLYAVTEFLIGVSAILVPYEFAWGHDLLMRVADGVAWQSYTYYLISGSWVAVTLLPWCFCMGATFPLAMAAIRRSVGNGSERSFSYLYVANVLGAVLGTLVPAFVLIEMLGFRGTLHATSVLNGLLATSAFILSLSSISANAPSAPPIMDLTRKRLYHLPEKTVLWFLFATGLISMGMEVVWIRQYTPYLGNVVYAFAAILAVYLVATLIGSRLYRVWVLSHEPRESAAAWVLLGLIGLLPLVSADPNLPIPSSSHQAGFVLGAIRLILGIGAFSALLGFLTPMLVDYWSGGDPDRAGNAYAINVLGSILGPLIAGFGLLPWMGDRWALVVFALPLFLMGFLAALERHPVSAHPYLGRRAAVRALFVIAASVVLIAVSKDYETIFPQRVVKRDYTASIVATGTGMRKNLVVNGIGMTSLTPITKMMAHLPLAFVNQPPQNGLVVCFGMGTTFRSMLTWGIHTTAVDLVPSVPAVFGFFHPDGPKLVKSPLAQVVIDDGRRFLEGSPTRYDVITLDPPPPVGASTSSLLYSREFYDIVKKHLRTGGVLQVWLPGGDTATQAAAAKALMESFPYVRAFGSTENWGVHFVASMNPLMLNTGAAFASRLPATAAADLIEWGPASTAEGQFDMLLAREVSVEKLIAQDSHVPAITDDEPINEYFLLRWDFHYYR